MLSFCSVLLFVSQKGHNLYKSWKSQYCEPPSSSKYNIRAHFQRQLHSTVAPHYASYRPFSVILLDCALIRLTNSANFWRTIYLYMCADPGFHAHFGSVVNKGYLFYLCTSFVAVMRATNGNCCQCHVFAVCVVTFITKFTHTEYSPGLGIIPIYFIFYFQQKFSLTLS